MTPEQEKNTDRGPFAWEKVVQLLVADTEDQDVLRHFSRALGIAISSARHAVVILPLCVAGASFWTPPSQYDTVVTAENILQYVRIDPSNSGITDAEPFFISPRAVCRANAEGLP